MTPRLGGRRGIALLTAIVVVLAGSAAATGAFATLQQPSGEEVLDRVEQRYDSAETLTSTAVVTVENETASVTATVEVAAAEENRTRVVVSSDGETYRAGSNGTVAWVVGPDRSAAWPVDALGEDGAMAGVGPEATDPRSAAPGDGDRRLTPVGTPAMNGSNVTATLVGTPTVDGTSTYAVELTRPEANGTATLWVAQDDYRVVRAVATDGTNRTEIDVESTAFDVAIHDSTFDPPADRVALTTVDRYDEFGTAQSNTDLALPSLDAAFEGATVTVRQGETIVGQRYVVDGENVTVVSTTATAQYDEMVENATTTEVDGQTVSVTAAEDRAVAVWTDDDVTTAVIVEGSSERAIGIAERLDS